MAYMSRSSGPDLTELRAAVAELKAALDVYRQAIITDFPKAFTPYNIRTHEGNPALLPYISAYATALAALNTLEDQA